MPGIASEAHQSQSIYDVPSDDEATPTTNGHDDNNSEERPLKRRRVSEGTPAGITRKKQESPPWKKAIAEGPSSFTQDGIRRSGRTNQIPLELQPPSNKRQTRGAIQKTLSIKSKYANGNPGKPSSNQGTTQDPATITGNTLRRPQSAGKHEAYYTAKSPSKIHTSPKRAHRNSSTNEVSPTPARTHRRSTSQVESQVGNLHRHGHKGRRSVRASDVALAATPNGFNGWKLGDDHNQGSKIKVPRIRFRVNPPSLPTVHPDIILRRTRLYPSFKDFIEKAGEVVVEKGGLLALDDDMRYTTEMATREARLIIRMEEAAKDGGVLSPGVSSAYRPDDIDRDKRNAIRQYAHQDHLVRAVTGFRALMLEEHNKHKRVAKRLAEACRDEWHRKQPKTQEEIEAEAMKVVEGRYRILMKSLQATWDNVKAEVNRRRLKDWEAEEQVRVRKALNQAVDISTQKLEARRIRRDSEALSEKLDSDVSSAGEESIDGDEDSDSNMSSSDSEADDERQFPDAADDEHLTVEELRQKYSNLPGSSAVNGESYSGELEPEEIQDSEAESLQNQDAFGMSMDDDSDESIDMDDDMGSSDDGHSSDENDEEPSVVYTEEDEDDDPGESGLLGFLAPSDLATLGSNQTTTTQFAMDEDDNVDEEDEVSLIPAPQQIQVSTPPSTSEKSQSIVRRTDEKDQTNAVSEASHEVDVVVGDIGSGDRSSQHTPETAETKPSEIDSASSIELQQSSRQLTHSATPQPRTDLKTPIPFLLRGTLREYQHYGLDWLAGLYANNTNGILADEMGLGKTIQTIALLAHLACEHHVWGPHLVVVPTSVMLNWEMEFKKWCPGFKILTYYGTQEERKKKRVGWANEDTWNVCITSYQLVLQDQQVFKRRKWHYMILDEAHNIKNFRSQRWQTLLTFNTRARLLLTGTPLQNNLTELWSLLFFLMPSDGTEPGIGGFADLKEFSDWFRKPQEQILENGRETMDDEARAIISKLHKVLRPYLLRRMKADVEKQMPGKYEHVEYCRLSRRQRELYDGFLSRSDTRGTLASGSYLSIINCLMQLRKVCNHPDLFQERPILSSFPMKKSAITDFEIKELLVRRRLLREDPMSSASLEFLNLVPTKHENLSGAVTERSSMLTAQRVLMDMREAQRARAQYALTSTMDPSTVKSILVYLESGARWNRFEELQHCVYLNALRRQQKPIYGSQLVELLSFGINNRPSIKKPATPDRVLDWMWSSSNFLREMVPTLEQRSQALQTTIQKFACVTPPIVAPDALPLILTRRGTERFQTAPNREKPDAFHEARMRLSVQFPDKRLLQYDCGKLQTLAKLLRKLQSGGHRALIFTQMTKVLDILEQFLNIHGHRYLRLDGATKIEQRQILTDRFNNDPRILAFILSSRSGGLGINLTGADTVIFYDLDWNPAMDKQCQDRCHRIGQTRDVHIYRLVSEHTIEANILRKANQKRMLDDVVIQEGEFTTDYFNKISVRDVLGDEALMDGDTAASAAMDRILGGPGTGGDVGQVLEQAEDQEDVTAAKVAQQEIVLTDAADFDEKAGTAAVTPKTQGTDTPMEDLPTSGIGATPASDALAGTPRNARLSEAVDLMDIDDDGENAWGQPIASTDDYMLKFITVQLKDTPLELPKDKMKSKRAKDYRHRTHRVR